MRAIINLLCTNSEVILRELISNSAHTPDNVRFPSPTNKTIDIDTTDLRVRVSIDAEKWLILIGDNRIVMDETEHPSTLGRSRRAGRPSSLRRSNRRTMRR